METIVMDAATNQTAAVEAAAVLLRQGEIVAFPTETVYGLGADAFNAAAVAKIFAAKQRPADNPLIVHLSDPAQLALVASTIPPSAQRLMEHFWPGPLSLVVPKHPNVPDIVTAGLSTVVVRLPSHPVAHALIAALGSPIAAPSANTSGSVSGTTAAHVKADFAGKVPLILDGGPTTHGLESTVVDCSVEPPVILRPGTITAEMLAGVIPNISQSTDTTAPRSPGMKYRHYSPQAPVVLFVGEETAVAEAMQQYIEKHRGKTVVIAHHTFTLGQTTTINLPTSPTEAAPLLFAALRHADTLAPDYILIHGYDEAGVGAAIMNRLRKAASTTIQC